VHDQKNERGMTLVVVLLTIMVFSVLGLAVVGASMNNVKQVSKTETDIQTVDIAEMGVQYYQSQLSDYFHGLISSKKAEYKQLIEDDFRQNKAITGTSIEAYEQKLAQELIDAYNTSSLYSQSQNKVSHTVDTRTNSYYRIDNLTSVLTCKTCNTTEPGERLELTYKSFGYTNQPLEKQITATFVFNFNIDKGEIVITSIPAQNYDYQTVIVKPVGIPSCSFDLLLDSGKGNGQYEFSQNCQFSGKVTVQRPSSILNSQLIFDNGVVFDQVMNKGITNSTLYITGDTILNKQINGIENSKIFIKGTSTGFSKIETINQGLHNSTIVIIGNVIFGEQNDKIKGLSHSTIYVVGSANFTNMDFKDYDNTSKICVKGSVIGTGLPSDLIYSDTLDKVQFEQKCSLGEIVDGDKTIEVHDQFLDWDEKSVPIVKYGD
jgi:type II secretory pathway pseudopilin PulG